MKMRTNVLSLALALFLCGAIAAQPVYAEGRRAVRSVRGSGLGRSIGRGPISGHSGARGIRGLGGLLNNSRRSSSSRGIKGLGNLLDLGRRAYDNRDGHGGRYGDWYRERHDDRYRADKEYADAMRDAAIANAIVGVVGIIADAATGPQMVVRQPCVAPAPAPEYRVERVLVQEGRYEEYRVWVPDRYDRATGEIVKGHYETRQRYVPEVWEERYVRIR